MQNNDKNNFTVVIPTLGHECLEETLLSLNASKIRPDEILICTPKKSYIKLSESISKNISIIETSDHGQVFQRMIGFSKAKSNFVMQLDDDISLDYLCTEKLLFELNKLGARSAISPVWISKETGNSLYSIEGQNYHLLRAIYCWLLNGSFKCEPGTITKAGTSVGVDHNLISNNIFAVDWLAGGCIMHKKDNLILNNFFPFPGKAYSEDLIHSQLLKDNGISLYVCKEAIGAQHSDPTIPKLDFINFILWIRDDMRAKKYFLKLSKKGFFRMYLYYIKLFINYPITRLVK